MAGRGGSGHSKSSSGGGSPRTRAAFAGFEQAQAALVAYTDGGAGRGGSGQSQGTSDGHRTRAAAQREQAQAEEGAASGGAGRGGAGSAPASEPAPARQLAGHDLRQAPVAKRPRDDGAAGAAPSAPSWEAPALSTGPRTALAS
jgi:hypothetical protein